MRRVVLAVAAFLALSRLTSAAEGMGPEAYTPALGVYIDGLVAAHAAAPACANGGAGLDDKAWTEAKAVLIATLWANGYPAAFINDATRRLDAPPAVKPDCATAYGGFYDSGWVAEIGYVLSTLGFTPVAKPVAPEQWQKIRDAIAAEKAIQARLLECVGVVEPALIVAIVHDWDEMLVRIGLKLIGAGLPRDQVSVTLGSVEANAIWQPAPPEKAAALAKACEADTAWGDRLATFQYLTLSGVVDDLLPAPPPN